MRKSMLHHRNLFHIALMTALVSSITASAPSAKSGNLLAYASGTQAQTAKVERLNYLPSLAFIPSYTGKAYQCTEAVHYTGLPTGECYNIKTLTREDSSAVLTWYQESLKQCGWTIDQKSSGSSTVCANREGGLNCFVYVRQLQKSSFASEVNLRFSIRPL